MGRPRWSSRLTVEQCLPLTVESYHRARTWECTSGATGTTSWTSSQGFLGKAGYTIQNDTDGLAIRIPHQYARICGELRLLEECLIPITATRPYLGGSRHWFRCPVVRNGKPCSRRVGRLYLPPGATAFGCRHCYYLTYWSAQRHDKRKAALARSLRAWLQAALLH